MRILLDECLPSDLARELPGHEVIVLQAPTNRIESLRPLIPDLLKALKGAKPGQSVRVGD